MSQNPNQRWVFQSFFVPFIWLLLTAVFVIDCKGDAGSNKVGPQDSSQQTIFIEEIQKDYLIYGTYQKKDTNRLDISDLIVSEDIIGKGNPLNTLYENKPDFKKELLVRGVAQLKFPETAPIDYKAAQQKAKDGQLYIWRVETPPRQITQTQVENQKPRGPIPDGTLQGIGNIMWKVVAFIVSLGAVGWLFLRYVGGSLYKKFWLQRRMRLLIIGHKSAGKTGLCMRIIDPNVPRQQILDLETTPGKREERCEVIPIGRFEVHPILIDISGSKPSFVWDQFVHISIWDKLWHIKMSKLVLLLVLSPTMQKENNPANKVLDEKFVYTQLGYVQAFIEGALGTKFTKKPQLLIIFLNKFDLFSKYPPDDSQSEITARDFGNMFFDHVECVTMAANKANIPYEIVKGSALEGWNCPRIKEIIQRKLYERR